MDCSRHPAYFSTTADNSLAITTLPPPLGQEAISHSVAGGPGFGFGLEYMWSDHLGIEGAAFLTYHDTDMVIANDLGSFSASDSTRFRTYTFGANYHFNTKGRAQWSLGGFVPLMFADGTDHVFPGLNRIEGRYMALLIMESETGGDVDVDPFVLSIGIGYRF